MDPYKLLCTDQAEPKRGRGEQVEKAGNICSWGEKLQYLSRVLDPFLIGNQDFDAIGSITVNGQTTAAVELDMESLEDKPWRKVGMTCTIYKVMLASL